MILLFMMGIGFDVAILLTLPIAIVIFITSKNFFKKRFKTEFNGKVLTWSLISTVILSPLILMGIIALIFFSFSFYENLN